MSSSPDSADDELPAEDPGPNDGQQRLRAADLLARYAAGERSFPRFDGSDIELPDADLRGSNFRKANFEAANLCNAQLGQTNFSDADLPEALLNGASLRDADLRNADLAHAQLEGADLTGADLRGTAFDGANLDRCILVGTRRDHTTDLRGVDLTRVICDQDLTRVELAGQMKSLGYFNWFEPIGTFICRLLILVVVPFMFCGAFTFFATQFLTEIVGQTVAGIAALSFLAITLIMLMGHLIGLYVRPQKQAELWSNRDLGDPKPSSMDPPPPLR